MCGFVGYTTNKKGNIKTIKSMSESIIHRGPDSDGYYIDDKISLGFRRLSIIDVRSTSSQPMQNEDNTITIVFNGEIYNYQELKKELIKSGHIFKNNSDTEVLIHGYEEYGTDILQKIRGMFSFAIWDSKKESLFIARDFFGIKPLYYTTNTKDNTLIFGSEIKAFLKHPKFIKELNDDALKPYLTFQYSAMDETFFKGVYKLKPGHYMIYKDNKLETHRYWKFEFNVQKQTIKDSINEIKKTMEESVIYHKISDVKVGSLLSGGIDSSYITALLKPHNTFTVGFKNQESKFNETNLAKDLSKILKIKNYKKLITADDFFEKLPLIQYHMDEPHSNLSAVPLYFLTQLARKHVTVILSGEGADELFGGYEWYEETKASIIYKKLPLFFKKSLSNISKFIPNKRIKNFINTNDKSVEETFIGQAYVFNEKNANSILKEKYKNGPSPRSITSDIYKDVKNYDDLSKKQYLDINLWMPGDILLKADKMSMANSVELRVPFLDKEVAKLASKMPSKLRVGHGQSKYALRSAALEVIPSDWAKRPKKGFLVPFRNWIKEEKYYSIIKNLFEEKFVEDFFEKNMLLEILNEHYENKKNRAREIYTVYCFLIWYKEYFIKIK